MLSVKWFMFIQMMFFCSNMFCTIDSYTRVAPVAFFCIHQTAPLV